jgi:hypothetical protein
MFRLRQELAPPTRPLSTPGHRGTSFSATPSWLLYNVAEQIICLPLDEAGAPSDGRPISNTFREFVVCHDLCHDRLAGGVGAGGSQLPVDIVALVALASGEVMRWRPLAKKHPAPCCKEGAADGSVVTLLRWCPVGDGSFVTAHANGQLLLYDRRREESAAMSSSAPPGAPAWPSSSSSSSSPHGTAGGGRRGMKIATLRGSGSGTTQATPPQRQTPVCSWQVCDHAASRRRALSRPSALPHTPRDSSRAQPARSSDATTPSYWYSSFPIPEDVCPT